MEKFGDVSSVWYSSGGVGESFRSKPVGKSCVFDRIGTWARAISTAPAGNYAKNSN